MKSRLIATAMTALLLLSALAIFPAAAYSGAYIELDPDPVSYTTDDVSVGDRFNITVWIKNVTTTLGGAQIQMYFDDSIILPTRWFTVDEGDGGFMPSPISALPSPPDPGYVDVSPGVGYVKTAVSKGGLPPSAPWGHSGIFGIFEFNVTALPPKLGSLSCDMAINNTGTYLLDETNTEISGVTKLDGSYSVSWAEPDPARMGVQPLLTEFGPYPPSAVGETFTIDVYIEDLYEAWYLTNATFDLYYNATVIDVLGDAANITIAPLWATSTVSVTRQAGLDYISIFVGDPTSTPGGSPADELVATILFTVVYQSEVPTVPAGYIDYSPLDFHNVTLMDHIGPVTTTAPNNGDVNIYALIELPVALFQVTPSNVTLGPEPSIGETFEIDIVISGPTGEGLHSAWYAIGFQCRLFYCPDLLEVVSVEEGPFLKDGPWNLYGTFFTGTVESDGLGPHVLIGNLLLPNATGDWDMTSWPNGTGSIATITFKAIKQECPDPFTCELGLGSLFGEWAIDKNGNYIPIDEGSNVNGTYTMLPFSMPGRVIDLYGGAKNSGYWTGYPDPFPAPYGGQGPDKEMDLVIPQSEITLYAEVTYNWWPVQSKDVGFEIEGPFVKNESDPTQLIPKESGYQRIWLKATARTNGTGIAVLTFRMPWPCDDPENITGIWLITATTSLADEVIIDTMPFYYEHLVNWVSVSTDKYYYTHGECIEVTVTYQTHAMMYYPALFSVALTDDLGVPVIMELVQTEVGGAEWCTWKTDAFTVELCIPKWAYAGYAYIHVNAYDKDPTDGGFAWTPEYTPPPEVQIGPY